MDDRIDVRDLNIMAVRDLKTQMNRSIRQKKVCQRRLDKMREAVAVYLAGDSTRKQLERVYHDTDPNYKAGE